MTFLATTNYCKSPWFKIRKSPSLCYLTFSFTIKCHCTLRKKCYKTLLSWLSLSKFQYFETACFIATCCRSPVTYGKDTETKVMKNQIPNWYQILAAKVTMDSINDAIVMTEKFFLNKTDYESSNLPAA